MLLTPEMVANTAIEVLKGPQPTKDPVFILMDEAIRNRFGIDCQSYTYLGTYDGTRFSASRHKTLKIKAFMDGFIAASDSLLTIGYGNLIKIKVPTAPHPDTAQTTPEESAPTGPPPAQPE